MKEFPSELFDLIISTIRSPSDLKHIRLVSKALSKPATRELFSRVHVTLPGLPGTGDSDDDEDDEDETVENEAAENNEGAEDDDEEISHFNSILASTVAKEVRTVQITTSLDPNRNLDDYHNDETPSVLTNKMKTVIQHVKHFPNLTNLAVEFSCVCRVVQADDFFSIVAEDSVEFRTEVLKALLAAINESTNPTSKLKSLALKNLQNVNDAELVRSKNFLDLLERISELRLKIIVHHDEASPESSWEHEEMYTFMAELPSVWLEPARENLTRLTLHMDEYWGYMPKADFRSLHLPDLKSLELGNYTFSHDWQLDWILSHETLVELVLDDCPILKLMRNFGDLDQEGYPVTPTSSVGASTSRRYDGTWLEYFNRIEKMPRLRILKFGVGEWMDGDNFDGAPLQEGPHESMYMQFDRRIGPTPWQHWAGISTEYVEDEEEEDNDENEDDQNINIAESITTSFEVQQRADEAAYERLMNVLVKR